MHASYLRVFCYFCARKFSSYLFTALPLTFKILNCLACVSHLFLLSLNSLIIYLRCFLASAISLAFLASSFEAAAAAAAY